MTHWDKVTVSGTIAAAACSRPDRDSVVIEIEMASTRRVVPNGLVFEKMHAPILLVPYGRWFNGISLLRFNMLVARWKASFNQTINYMRPDSHHQVYGIL